MIQLLATPPNTFFTRLLGVPFSFYSHCRRYVSLLCNKYFKFHTPWLEFLMFCWVGNFTRQVPPTTSLPLIALFLGRILLKYAPISLYCLFGVFLQIPIPLGSFSSLPGLKLHCSLQHNVAHPFLPLKLSLCFMWLTYWLSSPRHEDIDFVQFYSSTIKNIKHAKCSKWITFKYQT